MKRLEKVLLVDDDSITNFLNKKLIDRLEVVNEILTAGNGREALKVFKDSCKNGQHCPDVIFLDLNMPIMNGFEFLDEYTKLTEDCKTDIFVLTTSCDERDMTKLKQYPISKVLNKPLTMDKLEDVFTRYQD